MSRGGLPPRRSVRMAATALAFWLATLIISGITLDTD